MSLPTIIQEIFAKDFELDEVKKINGRLFDFKSNGKSTLFVSIGDSWTYGARLNEEAVNESGDQCRQNKVFGNLVADYLEADWCNLSIPGINNLWMLEKYQMLCEHVNKLDYEKVIVFITLTEYGREISTDFDLSPELNQKYYARCLRVRDIAQALADYTADGLLEKSNPKIKLMLGTNYVNNIYPDKLKPLMLEKSWLEVLTQQPFDDECLVVGSWVIPKYKNLTQFSHCNIDSTQMITDLDAMISTANKRLDVLYNTGLTHKTGYGHPTSEGHQRWCNYIKDFLK